MEAWLRLGVSLAMLVGLAVWERQSPRRVLTQPPAMRWRINLGLAALNALCIRLSVGALAVQTAVLAHEHAWGLWHVWSLSPVSNAMLSLLVLDFAIYLQHVACHRVPWLWRLHLVHHTDADMDVTTGLRFHPLEIVLSLGYKTGLVLLLGVHPVAVIVFEGLLHAAAQFHHSNIALPDRVAGVLQYGLITPDAHRIHHSVCAAEMQSNFGFSVPWWDRLCGTYCAQPVHVHTTMPLGVLAYQRPTPWRFTQLLALPFHPVLAAVQTTK